MKRMKSRRLFEICLMTIVSLSAIYLGVQSLSQISGNRETSATATQSEAYPFGARAQSLISTIDYDDYPATATYVIKANGTLIWAVHYNGSIVKNSTDAGTVIQYAVDAVGPNGGIVFIKAGTYTLNSTWIDVRLTNSVRLIGEGCENTILRSINPWVQIGINLESDYSEIRDLTLLGPEVSIWGDSYPWGVGSPWRTNGTKVLGCKITGWTSGIRYKKSSNFGIIGNMLENCFWGIWVNESSDFVASSNMICDIDCYGINVQASQNAVVAQNTLRNWGTAIDWSGAIYVHNSNGICENINIIGNTLIGGDLATTYHGISLSGEDEDDPAYYVRKVNVIGNTMTGVLGKTSPGIYLHSHYNPFILNVEDCVISSNIVKNFNVGIQTAGARDITITGNVAVENNYHGMWLTDAYHFSVTGNTVKNNGQGLLGDGISLSGDDCLISGNICIDDQASPTQRYGIAETVWCDNNLVTNNLVKGNVQGGIAKAGSNTIVRGNLGYATEESGTAILPTGATFVSFPHGLAGSPQVVTFSWKTDTGYGKNARSSWWAANSTHITISISSSASADYSLSWYAEYRP